VLHQRHERSVRLSVSGVAPSEVGFDFGGCKVETSRTVATPIQSDDEAVSFEAGKPPLTPRVDPDLDHLHSGIRRNRLGDTFGTRPERPERLDSYTVAVDRRWEAFCITQSPNGAVAEHLGVEGIGLGGAH
jgi:hypothetical protein